MPLERLQKIIAAAGVCSRRAAEDLITAGRVRVNGPAVTELGAKADPETDEILVDGKPLRRSTPHVYIMLNKPRGCVTTVEDPEGRPTVMEFLKRIKERIYPVGRLDFHSEGLLLFTNDGDFANRVLATGFGVNKTYWAKVHGTPEPEALNSLREGVMMDGRRTLPAEIHPLPQQGGEDWRDEGRRKKLAAKSRRPARVDEDDDSDDSNPWFEVVLQEGRQNQIRRMFDLIGHPVRKLRRVRIGRLTLGTLKPGEFRHLTPEEVDKLMAGEREKTVAAPRKRRSAADFRKAFARGAEESTAIPAVDGDEDVFMEPPSGPAPAATVQAAESDEVNTEAREVTPAEMPKARRPFERRPERPVEARFPQRSESSPRKYSQPGGERPRYEGRPREAGRPPRGDRKGPSPYRSNKFDQVQPSRPQFGDRGKPRYGGDREQRFSAPRENRYGAGPKPRFDGPREQRFGGERDNRFGGRPPVGGRPPRRDRPDDRPAYDRGPRGERPTDRPRREGERSFSPRPFTPSPHGGAPYRSGPPRSGPPRSEPYRSGPSRNEPFRGTPSRSGPPRSDSYRSGPPRSGAPRSGPPRSGPFRSGPPRSGPERSGPPSRGPQGFAPEGRPFRGPRKDYGGKPSRPPAARGSGAQPPRRPPTDRFPGRPKPRRFEPEE